MLSLLHRRCDDSPIGVLLTAIERLADVVAQPMGDIAARLDLTGPRPVLFVDPRTGPDDLRCVLPEVLAAIVIGPAGAPSARQAPKLVAVS